MDTKRQIKGLRATRDELSSMIAIQEARFVRLRNLELENENRILNIMSSLIDELRNTLSVIEEMLGAVEDAE